MTYVVDPADVGADPGEDRGLLVVVAAHAGAKAHHAVHVPGAIGVLAVQGTARVSLKDKREKCANRALRAFVKYVSKATHVAAGQLAVSSGTDHAAGDQAAPPVVSAAGLVADNREAGLLQDVSDRPPSWRKEEDSFSPNRTCPSTDSFCFRALTPETAPSGHVAGRIVGQDFARRGKTGGHDGVTPLDGSGQLDQGNVVAARQEG